MSFTDREEHLRQRVTRGWADDEDIITCMMEIDRLKALVGEAPPIPPIEPNRSCEEDHPVVCMECYEGDAEAYAESRYER
jgi:hypothetical protein